MDKVTGQCPQTKERRAEAVSNRGPSAYQPNALPLGQTGSQVNDDDDDRFYTAHTPLSSRLTALAILHE